MRLVARWGKAATGFVFLLAGCTPLRKTAYVESNINGRAVIQSQGNTREEAIAAANEKAATLFTEYTMTDADCAEKLSQSKKERRGLAPAREPSNTGKKGFDNTSDAVMAVSDLMEPLSGWECKVTVAAR